MAWQFHEMVASAGEFHARDLPPSGVWSVQVADESLVLGSRQGDELVDIEKCLTLGVEVTTRRSGGGIVHLVPGEHVWIDVVISEVHPRWTDDVVASTRWLGVVWANALSELGVECAVHGSRLEPDPLGDVVCFAAVGPGEVVDRRGAKLVGISQRRGRGTARFQCTVLCAWRPDRLSDLLRTPFDPDQIEQLKSRVATVDQSAERIESAFRRALLAN